MLKRFAVVLVAFAFLSGCWLDTVPTPKTPRQSLVAAETAYTSAVKIATALRPKMNPGQLDRANTLIHKLDKAFDVAHAHPDAIQDELLQFGVDELKAVLSEVEK